MPVLIKGWPAVMVVLAGCAGPGTRAGLQASERRAHPALSELVAAVEEGVRSGHDDAERIANVVLPLARFLKEGLLDERYQRPHPGLDVTTYLLYAAPDGSFSITVLVLQAGARTPIHDHQTWTVWGTYRGRDRETRYERRAAKRGGFPELIPTVAKVLPDAGVSVVPPPPHDVHQLENIGKGPSVSIHVHGADMRKQARNAYDPRRRSVTSFVQSYEGTTER